MRIATRAAWTLLLIVACVPAADAAKRKAKTPAPGPAGYTVTDWLVLGPAIDPLPLFGDEERGAYALEQRLEARVLPPDLSPREGDVEEWFGEAPLEWTARRAASEGRLGLDPPEGSSATRPAVAWIAAYLASDRFVKRKLDLRGSHARQAWVGGKRVAGGTGEGEAEVAGTIELTTGKHLLLVETLWTGEGEWTIGATLLPESEDEERAEPADGPTASLDPSRGVTIHDILDPPSISSVSVSADGTFVAASLSRYHPGTDVRESWIEVWAGGLYRTWRGGTDMGQVAWAPRGHRLSYVSSEGEGKERRSTIWLADIERNTVRPLLERVADFQGYRWSPDGRTIAYLTSVEPKPDERGVKRLESIMDRWADHRTKRYLNLAQVPGGARRRLTAGPISTEGAAFSPDGSKLLFQREVEDLEDRPFSVTELWEVDLRTAESRKLRSSRWLQAASYSPDGNRILIQGGAQEFGETGVNVPPDTIPNSYDGQLFLWNPEADTVAAITRDFDPSVRSAIWSRADGNVYLTAEDRDYVRLYRYDVEAGTFTALETGYDVFGRLALARSAPVAAGVGTSPWKPQGLVIVDLVGGTKYLRTRPAREWFEHVQSGTVEAWSFTTADGTTIDGRIYLPPGFDPEKKYPAIVYYYGGTSPTSRSFGGRYPKEYWASQGYVVYTLQPSGATGFGQAFSARHVNDWGKTTSEEIIEGTRRFLEAHPYVNPKRVGCIGASYGGFMTMLLTTKTDLYAAAVAHAGISSLASYWGEGYWGYSYSSIATAESYPWNRRDVYVDQSPLFRADRARVPLLLTHGAADTNVPVGESDQFYIALKLLGKDVEYLQVAEQDHWIVDHDKRILWSQSIVAWFDRWLKDQPDWWNHLYP